MSFNVLGAFNTFMSPLSNWLARQRDLLNQESHGVNNKNRLPGPPDKTATGVNNTAEMPPLHSGPPGLPHPGAAFKVKTKGLAFKSAVLCGTCDSKTGLIRDQDGHIIIIEKLKDSPLPKRLDPKGYLVSQPHQSASYKVLRCDKNFDERQIIEPTSEDPLRLENGDPPSQPHIGDFHNRQVNPPDANVHLQLVRNLLSLLDGFPWRSNSPKHVAQHQPEELLKPESPKKKPSTTPHSKGNDKPKTTHNYKHVASPDRPKNKVQNAGNPCPAKQPKRVDQHQPEEPLKPESPKKKPSTPPHENTKNKDPKAGESRPVNQPKRVLDKICELDKKKTSVEDLEAKILDYNVRIEKLERKKEDGLRQLDTYVKNNKKISRIKNHKIEIKDKYAVIKDLEKENEKIKKSGVMNIKISKINTDIKKLKMKIKKLTMEIDDKQKKRRAQKIAHFEKPRQKSLPGHVAAAAA